VVFRKTSISLMTSYLVIAVLFTAPLAVVFFLKTFFPEVAGERWIEYLSVSSPVSAAFALPIDMDTPGLHSVVNLPLFLSFLTFYFCLNGSLIAGMIWLFNIRWRVTD